MAQTGGVLSFSLFLPLATSAGATGSSAPSSSAPMQAVMPLLWALGNSWDDSLSDLAQHFARSSVATYVDLVRA